MDGQTLLVLTIVTVAAFYVGRALWPSRRAHAGCSSCSHNRNRSDDYA
jgi:hypothetical protein